MVGTGVIFSGRWQCLLNQFFQPLVDGAHCKTTSSERLFQFSQPGLKIPCIWHSWLCAFSPFGTHSLAGSNSNYACWVHVWRNSYSSHSGHGNHWTMRGTSTCVSPPTCNMWNLQFKFFRYDGLWVVSSGGDHWVHTILSNKHCLAGIWAKKRLIHTVIHNAFDLTF